MRCNADYEVVAVTQVYVLSLGEDCKAQWYTPVISGNTQARYGNSFVRCGAAHDLFLIFGGLTCGGYVGEINNLSAIKLVHDSGVTTPQNMRWSGEWQDIKTKGEKVPARGYATLAVSQDGCTVYAFGGICNSNCCNTLSVLDVPSWTWTSPSCTGANLGICFSLEVAVPSRKHKSWVLLKASLCQFLVRMSLFLQEIIRASDLEAHRQYGAINSGL